MKGYFIYMAKKYVLSRQYAHVLSIITPRIYEYHLNINISFWNQLSLGTSRCMYTVQQKGTKWCSSTGSWIAIISAHPALPPHPSSVLCHTTWLSKPLHGYNSVRDHGQGTAPRKLSGWGCHRSCCVFPIWSVHLIPSGFAPSSILIMCSCNTQRQLHATNSW